VGADAADGKVKWSVAVGVFAQTPPRRLPAGPDRVRRWPRQPAGCVKTPVIMPSGRGVATTSPLSGNDLAGARRHAWSQTAHPECRCCLRSPTATRSKLSACPRPPDIPRGVGRQRSRVVTTTSDGQVYGSNPRERHPVGRGRHCARSVLPSRRACAKYQPLRRSAGRHARSRRGSYGRPRLAARPPAGGWRCAAAGLDGTATAGSISPARNRNSAGRR